MRKCNGAQQGFNHGYLKTQEHTCLPGAAATEVLTQTRHVEILWSDAQTVGHTEVVARRVRAALRGLAGLCLSTPYCAATEG